MGVEPGMWKGMNNFKMWLDNLPSTNFKIFISALLSCGTALVLFAAFILRIPVNESVLALWLGYLGAFAGINYLQFAKKRETYRPSPPNTPDVEDAGTDTSTVRSTETGRSAPGPIAPPVPPRVPEERLHS